MSVRPHHGIRKTRDGKYYVKVDAQRFGPFYTHEATILARDRALAGEPAWTTPVITEVPHNSPEFWDILASLSPEDRAALAMAKTPA